jgi:hypothetical protein
MRKDSCVTRGNPLLIWLLYGYAFRLDEKAHSSVMVPVTQGRNSLPASAQQVAEDVAEEQNDCRRAVLAESGKATAAA